MRVDQLSDADALTSLNSAPEGLSAADAENRLREFGPNVIAEVARESPLRLLLAGLSNFFALILWLAAALAFFAEWSAPGQGMAKGGKSGGMHNFSGVSKQKSGRTSQA